MTRKNPGPIAGSAPSLPGDDAGDGPWSFVVLAPPKTKNNSPRVVRNGRIVGIPDKRTQAFEATVAFFASRVLPACRIDGPLRLDMLAVLERPKRLMRADDPDGLMLAPTVRRYDLENIIKAGNDGLARWFDDGQIVDVVARKRYAEKTGAPRVEITISRMSPAAER